MSKRLKFKPIITRIKLNSEQAGIACNCITGGATAYNTGSRTDRSIDTSSVGTFCGTAKQMYIMVGRLDGRLGRTTGTAGS